MLRTALLSLACAALVAQAPDPFAPARFLAGDWEGEGTGAPGQGGGGFSFRFELDGRALVRRSWTAFPARDGRPASRHEDLMTLFVEGGRLRALYVDNEGHVIRYTAAPPDTGEGLVLLSEPGPGPAFRLTYRGTAPGVVSVAFAVAPPGKSFSTYVEGVCHRKNP